METDYSHNDSVNLLSYCTAGSVFSSLVQGDSGGLGLGYVDINSVSFRGYPETELSQHNPVRDHQTHPVEGFVSKVTNINQVHRSFTE